ncbi:MAG: restriction endonuclease subunit S [Bacteroidetes bacterium]|nr:restriction endonuclease subunit S [Bacteroidota bacterium]
MDDLIAAQGRKIDVLRQYKLGLMQQLFPQAGETTPRLRFSDFTDAGRWKPSTLGKAGTFMMGGKPSFSVPEYWGGDIQWFTPADIKKRKLSKSKRTITAEGLNNSSSNLLPTGAIIIATGANIGNIGITENPCAISGRLHSLIVEPHDVNLFWYYWLEYYNHELTYHIRRSMFIKTSSKELEEMRTLRPQKAEQQKIADCLATMDDLIEAEVIKTSMFQQYKYGLVQRFYPQSDLNDDD